MNAHTEPTADEPQNTKAQESKSLASGDTTGPPWPWSDLDQKRKAFLKIMRAIIDKPDLGQEYLNCDEKARQAFRDAGMDVPADIKVVFLPAGDGDKLFGASAVMELPKPGIEAPTDDELMELMVANYTIVW